MNLNCLYNEVCNQVNTLDCDDSCIRYLEITNLLTNSGIPKNRWVPSKLTPDECDFNAFCKLADLKDDIVDFVKNGNNLYLYSDKTGNGKTSWAIKLMLKYFDSIWAGNGFRCRGIFVHTPTLLTTLKNFETKDPAFEMLKSQLPNVDLVIWDDIASSNLSNYDLSQLITFIDQRILCSKSNIFTGNFNLDGLNKYLGARLSSRIWNSSDRVELKGSDKR